MGADERPTTFSADDAAKTDGRTDGITVAIIISRKTGFVKRFSWILQKRSGRKKERGNGRNTGNGKNKKNLRIKKKRRFPAAFGKGPSSGVEKMEKAEEIAKRRERRFRRRRGLWGRFFGGRNKKKKFLENAP